MAEGAEPEADPETAAVAGPEAASADAGLPEVFALHAAAPSSFADPATLLYELPEAPAVRIAVYDLLGREVAVLVDSEVTAGRHAAVFEGRGIAAGCTW